MVGADKAAGAVGGGGGPPGGDAGTSASSATEKKPAESSSPKPAAKARKAPKSQPGVPQVVKRHRAGNVQVVKDGQRWNLAPGAKLSDIPATDPVGDALQAAAKKAAAEFGPSRLSLAEARAIDKARRAGRQWEANLLGAQAKGRYVERVLKEQFRNLKWNASGPDVVEKGIAYDIMSGANSNIDRHAKRMANQTFRMITF